jgi:hypothetical protein
MTVIRPIDAAAGAAPAPACGPGVTVQVQQKPADESPAARRAREYTLTLPALRGIRATFFAVTTPIAVVDASYRNFPITHFSIIH